MLSQAGLVLCQAETTPASHPGLRPRHQTGPELLLGAYYNRGMAYMDLRQLERAIQDCDQAIKLRRRSGRRVETRLCRSLLQGQLSNGEVDED